ncbi:DUF4190 domain-containing protein [Quadrisphaera oryzae]|uniref:DUF4190 domain-containing protein n=1 Tax=Quadrisphaera oryzae TaxID=2509661 RepID=UPI00404513A1
MGPRRAHRLRGLARREITRTGEGGYGMATWGLGLGIAYASLYVLYFLFFVVYALAILGLASHAFTSTGGLAP